MLNWLMYWRPSTERGGKLYHAVSDQKRVKDKVQLGDAVWFATIEDHELILFGHMLVGEKISQSAAEEKFGEEVWSGECHLIPKAPERYVKISISDLAFKLRFDSKRRPQLSEGYSGRNLQTMRKLTAESAALLRCIWDKEKSKRTRQKS